ncbi:hypothetical protein LU293_02140 [Moraxella nasovis]|uniref:hypothetical protein n=1 Tax=Moraxella nasovis TaxID=2904121 RepID=UPI001F60B4C2|nr:hypothetical protein [Moraxella nasovis]UNU73732.1 hypothetical protein LU293_02140 [Moraxella nasovis]
MIDKLKDLEQAVHELTQKYNNAQAELSKLRHAIAHDDKPQQIANLQSELNSTKADAKQKTVQIEQLEQSRTALQSQIESLVEQNHTLSEKNQELKNKNNLAISRAEVIQDWLAKIDTKPN